MPSVHSSPFYQMTENPAIISLLRRHHPHHSQSTNNSTPTTTTKPGPTGGDTKIKLRPAPKNSSSSSSSSSGGLFKMFKLLPMLTSGCKMVALLGGRGPRRPMLKDNATTGTIFGYRKGRVSLAVQEDPHCMPVFVIELPLQTAALNKEMQAAEEDSAAAASVRIALESETKTHRKKLMEEFVWAVYCNGRKVGYSIRRMHMTHDELHVMHSLRGVSMGAGVLPAPAGPDSADGDLTYMRARFDRVVGSKDSEALYMINPDTADPGPELCIFFARTPYLDSFFLILYDVRRHKTQDSTASRHTVLKKRMVFGLLSFPMIVTRVVKKYGNREKRQKSSIVEVRSTTLLLPIWVHCFWMMIVYLHMVFILLIGIGL